MNTLVAACLRFYFWPKTHIQASKCKLVRYHGAKSMIGFPTILCVSEELAHNFKVVLKSMIGFSTILYVSDELLHAIGAYFQGSILY